MPQDIMQPELSERDVERLRQQYAYVDEANATIHDDDIDFSDIPPLTDEQLAQAVRNPYLRPRAGEAMVPLAADAIIWFRQRYPDYQTAMNAALRAFMNAHSDEETDDTDLRKTA